jgi:hypothetical protein
LIVVIVEIVKQGAFVSELAGTQRDPEIIGVILDRRPQVLCGLVIQTGIASLKIKFGQHRKGKHTDHLEIKGPEIQKFYPLVLIPFCFGPDNKETDQKAQRINGKIRCGKESNE